MNADLTAAKDVVEETCPLLTFEACDVEMDAVGQRHALAATSVNHGRESDTPLGQLLVITTSTAVKLENLQEDLLAHIAVTEGVGIDQDLVPERFAGDSSFGL